MLSVLVLGEAGEVLLQRLDVPSPDIGFIVLHASLAGFYLDSLEKIIDLSDGSLFLARKEAMVGSVVQPSHVIERVVTSLSVLQCGFHGLGIGVRGAPHAVNSSFLAVDQHGGATKPRFAILVADKLGPVVEGVLGLEVKVIPCLVDETLTHNEGTRVVDGSIIPDPKLPCVDGSLHDSRADESVVQDCHHEISQLFRHELEKRDGAAIVGHGVFYESLNRKGL